MGVAKREAEAEADPALLYGAYGYAGLGHVGYAGHVGYPYDYGYAGYPYAAAGYASYSPSASTSIAGVAHVAKREAEAEADPALLYGAYGYAGLGHVGYAGHVGYPYAYGYAGYPYAAAGYAS